MNSDLAHDLQFNCNPAETPVALKNFQSCHPFNIALLRALKQGGIGSPVLFGGAVRDDYLGIPHTIGDYDIWADFGTLLDPSKFDETTFPQQLAKSILEVLPGSFIKSQESDLSAGKSGFIACKLTLEYEAKEISLFLNNRPVPPQEKIQGDAPLNAIIMTAEGDVFAHPQFETHAKKRLYAPYSHIPPSSAAARFNHLSAKIPGLVCTPRIKSVKPPLPRIK